MSTESSISISNRGFAQPPLAYACAQLAKTHGLSPRETEVFLLLARGRNAKYIQQKLFISLYTAKSHKARIFQKLGVHSTQEMLDLIDMLLEA